MFAIIKDNYKIIKFNLSEDINYKAIHIYKKNNEYYIDLKKGYYFEDNSKTKIISRAHYKVIQDQLYYSMDLYIYDNDNGINNYALYKNSNFVIANSNKANIICLDPYLYNNYLLIKDNKIDSNFDISINGHQYNGEILNDGDVIEYLGIKIIYYYNFIYINSFNINIKLSKYCIQTSKIKYKEVKSIDKYYIPSDINELVIKDIDDFISPKKINNIDSIKSILPNIIMCLSMSLMAYINYLSNSDNKSIWSYIIMPISMIITSILIPVIFIVINNISYSKEYADKKSSYLSYLDKYEENLIDDIKNYIDSLNTRFFSLINSKKMMFYATRNSDEYLKLSIGKIICSRQIKYKKTEDLVINDKLIEIEKITNNIEDYPLFLDILSNNKITIVSKNIDKIYYFYKFLLEIAYKHHYFDIYIAIYSKDNTLFNYVYNLPHLFFNNIRLTFSSVEQLRSLNQLKLDKPLILFEIDKVNELINNENIYQIYFSNDISDILKDSCAIVDYSNKLGYLYKNGRTSFNYSIESINFIDYFEYIGRYRSINNKDNRYTFNTLFKNSINSYYSNNDHSLKTKFAFNGNEIFSFDLHETKQGPHGLIGGSTGSGKSELIISLLLSLCIRYSPEYLNIVLIDYKGGGLKESLSYNGLIMPHIIANVSNLENNSLQRLIIALHNECKRRLYLFKYLSNASNISIMNIDDYLENNKNLENIAHLLIVVDEFAELKKEHPEQIKELISISRIGRSLGIHLILATQKPAGVIDDEIWSNSRFKIALKVFDEKDSQDIIKCKDAAYLNNPGSFLMLVDGKISKGQSIYAKTDIYNNDPFKVSLLNNDLSIYKTFKRQDNKVFSCASYYVNEISKYCRNMKIKKIDFLPPESKKRHSLTKDKCIVLGEVDDYINAKRGLLAYSLKESLLIYSGRKNELNAILNTLNENGIHSVVIGNSIYEGKYISDSITYDNSEDIEYLLRHLLNNRNNNLTLIVEDINSLFSYDDKYLDTFCKLIKRKDSININLILLTSSTQISFKLLNLFKNKILININVQDDLSSFYGMRSQYKGKSYFYMDEPICFVPIKLEEFISGKQIIPNLIKRIPETVNSNIKNDMYLVGYDLLNKNPVYLNNFVVISMNQELLNIYKRSYLNINTYLYNNQIKIDESIPMLWLGSGIFNQRLFVTGLNEDLKQDQAILINNYSKKILRSLNNV